jgi:FkbM family methyltransferase
MPIERGGPLARSFLSRMFKALSGKSQRFMADLVARSAEEITYRRLLDIGFRPSAIIDVGAFQGDWSRLASGIFDAPPILMVEAQPGKRAALEAAAKQIPGARIAMAVLGAKASEPVTFYEMGTGSSFLPEASDAPRTAHHFITNTLDAVVADNLVMGDNAFLKIDVQGAELHVLRGAKETLRHVEVVQLEAALLQYNEGAPLLPELVSYMAEQGFLPIEVSGYSRPRHHLVQIDLLFARENSSLRPSYFHFQSDQPATQDA